MDGAAHAAIAAVSEAFRGAVGPAKLRVPESGWYYKWEGKRVAKALLALDPKDIRYEDIIHPIDGSFVPGWATTESLQWLLPGLLRVCFEVNPHEGDELFRRLFSELHQRIVDGEVSLTPAQSQSLGGAHEAFYRTEEFDWISEIHQHPLIDVLQREAPIDEER